MPEYQDVEDSLHLEMVERMPKSMLSGSFQVSDDLINKAGSLGGVIQAAIDRANHINATIEISIGHARVNRFYSDDQVPRPHNRTLIEWTK